MFPPENVDFVLQHKVDATDTTSAMNRSASVIVEVLAVLFVVGILAVVAIPDNERQRPGTQQRALIASLERVRTALDRYWGDHDATYPSLDDLRSLVRPPGAPKTRSALGAYLNRLPDNPFTSGNRVAPDEDPVGSSDWIYNPEDGVFKANDNIEHRAL